ncbi:BglG family transcription antiterminator [Helcococcus ovis]|uniref:BglG family transcription antiterminator n=1 Tax=Helcococcus ovis TaxID=72026 RepID=UPI0038B8D1C1
MFNDKEIYILRLFLQNKYIHFDSIAESMSISSRTVSRIISGLKVKLTKYNMDFKFNNHKGYKLNIKSKRDYFNLQKDLTLLSKATVELKIIEEILKNSPITITSLAERLYYSESIISSKLKQVDKLLSRYKLKYYSKPNYGIEIQGNELEIRNFLINEYMIFSDNNIVDCILTEFTGYYFNKISDIVTATLIKHHLILSDMDYSNLLATTIVAMFRSKSTQNLLNNQYEDYSDLVKDIVISVNNCFDMEIGLNEIGYISSNTIFSRSSDLNDLSNNKLKNIIDMAISIIDKENPNYYKFNNHFYNLLFIHIDLLIKRSKGAKIFINPLLNNIKQEYIVEFNDAIKLGGLINRYFGLKISDDEISYLAIHLASVSNRESNNKTAIIICNYGVGTSLIVKEKIEKANQGVNIIGVYPSTYLDLALEIKPDYIISTIKLKNYQSNIPLIDASDILINKNYKLDFNKGDDFKFFFNEKNFFDVDYQSKEELINDLKNKIKASTNISDYVLDAVIERENLSTTETGYLFAMPHAIVEGDFDSIIAVFRNKGNIHWTLGEVRLVFVLILNRKDFEKIEILKKIYKRINDKRLIDNLLLASNYQEFLEILYQGDLYE